MITSFTVTAKAKLFTVTISTDQSSSTSRPTYTRHAWREGDEKTVCGVPVRAGQKRSGEESFDTSVAWNCGRCRKAVRKANPDLKDWQRYVADEM